MLCLSDFVAGRKRFYILSRGLYISASKHCRKMKFRTHIHLTSKENVLILSHLSDFMTCSERFNIQSERAISQLEHCRKIKFSTCICSSDTHIHKL